MRYDKPPLTYQEQAERLINRGLIADKDALVSRLQAVSYYRLSGYLYPFRQPDDSYRPGTTLDTIWHRYTFDRRLRLLLLDPIERIEVSVRTSLVYELSHQTGPFGYTQNGNLPNLSGDRLGNFLTKLYEEKKRSPEEFVLHFNQKYGDVHAYLPLWMSAEIMPFGMTLTLYRGVAKPIKQKIARELGVADDVLFSWLNSLNAIRNICAHHGRLWNRILGVKPMIPRGHKNKDWQTPVLIPNDRIFAVLSISKYMLDRIAPQSAWPQRLKALFAEYLEIPLGNMGFPKNWENSPIWK